MNYRTLTEKGNILNKKEFEKLQYNLVSSASESSSIEGIENNSIIFSNGDVYTYDADKQNVLKNGGILVKNVIAFEAKKSYSELLNINENAKNNINEYSDYVLLNVTFRKYDMEAKKQIFVTARGDDLYEIN